jgi:leishmanolysin
MISFKTFLLLFALICISQSSGTEEYACNHDEVEHDSGLLDVEEDMSSLQNDDGRVLAESSYPNLRIYPYYEFLKQSAPSSYASYFQNDLIPPVISYFQSALRIKYPISGNLKLGSSVNSICERSTPSFLKSTGVSADLFLYIDSGASSSTQTANSKFCYRSSSTKRPLISRIMVFRNRILEAKGDVLLHEKNMYVMMHELTHGLGFSNYAYGDFLTDSGSRRTGHIKSVRVAGSTRTVIDVPALTNRVRSFFGCSTIPGAPMENDGGSSTASSHFERRLFVYDMMSSGGIHGRRITEFDLAMLESSGWYVPNYSYAEPYFFGQGQGCDFINGACSASEFNTEYCSGSSRGCSPHGLSGGYCQSDSLSNGCRYNYPNEDFHCENPDAEDYARLPNHEVFGRGVGSRCFAGNLNTRSSSSGATSFCFKYNCVGTGSFTQLEVLVGQNKIICTQEGTKTLSGFYGAIKCPDPQTFCNTIGKPYCPKNCMGRGTCVNNKCQCNSGFKGTDCGLRV